MQAIYISTTHGYYRAVNGGTDDWWEVFKYESQDRWTHIGDWNSAKEEIQSWLNKMYPQRNEQVIDIE